MKRLFLIFYCMVREDGTNSVYSRTIYLMEILLTLVFISLTEVILGLLNISIGDSVYYIIFILPSPILAYLIIKNSINETKGKEIIHTFSEQISSKRFRFSLLAIGLLICAFLTLIGCGMLMSHLLSLYQ